MIKPLLQNVCMKMTTAKKEKFKSKGYAQKYDTTRNFIIYLKNVEDFLAMFITCGITASDKDRATAAIAQMFQSKYFMEEKLIEWE